MKTSDANSRGATRETGAKRKSKKVSKRGTPQKVKSWELRLYVAGHTPKSLAAFANLRSICEEHLAGEYHIEVIDLLKNPQLARTDQIVAVPTLVRKLPEPIRKIIGHLADAEKVLVGLLLCPRGLKDK